MGAGQAEDAVEIGVQGQRPGDLGFLATHHVGGFVLAEAGGDADIKPWVVGGDQGQARGIRRRARDGAVIRLAPALAGPDHAAGEDCGFAGEPRFDQGKKGGLKGIRGQFAHALIGFGVMKDACGTHRPDAQVGGAPINGDPSVRHSVPPLCLVLPVP